MGKSETHKQCDDLFVGNLGKCKPKKFGEFVYNQGAQVVFGTTKHRDDEFEWEQKPQRQQRKREYTPKNGTIALTEAKEKFVKKQEIPRVPGPIGGSRLHILKEVAKDGPVKIVEEKETLVKDIVSAKGSHKRGKPVALRQQSNLVLNKNNARRTRQTARKAAVRVVKKAEKRGNLYGPGAARCPAGGKNAKRKQVRYGKLPDRSTGVSRKDPVARNPTPRARYFRPTTHQNGRGMNVKGQDLWFSYNTTNSSPVQGDIINQMELNPAALEVARLTRLSACFQKFKFKSFKVHYETMASFNSSGGFGIYIDDDCTTTYANNSPNNLEIAGAHNTFRYVNMAGCGVASWTPSKDPTRYWINETSAVDPRTSCQGRAFIMCATTLSLNQAAGIFWIEYDIDFFDWALDQQDDFTGPVPMMILANLVSLTTNLTANGDLLSQLALGGTIPYYLLNAIVASPPRVTPQQRIGFGTSTGTGVVRYGNMSAGLPYAPINSTEIGCLLILGSGSLYGATAIPPNLTSSVNCSISNVLQSVAGAGSYSSFSTIQANNSSQPWAANVELAAPSASATWTQNHVFIVAFIESYASLKKLNMKEKLANCTVEELMAFMAERGAVKIDLAKDKIADYEIAPEEQQKLVKPYHPPGKGFDLASLDAKMLCPKETRTMKRMRQSMKRGSLPPSMKKNAMEKCYLPYANSRQGILNEKVHLLRIAEKFEKGEEELTQDEYRLLMKKHFQQHPLDDNDEESCSDDENSDKDETDQLFNHEEGKERES